MRVMIADHEPTTLSALKLWLEKEKLHKVVSVVSTIPDALAALRTAQPEVLLLDWELLDSQETNGIADIRSIRPSIWVIVMSGKPEHWDEAMVAGADRFVSKINPPEVLAQAIDSFRPCTERRIA